jgi:hypothetical protein
MTTAEFLALAPRERDAVVAEKVLGWGWVKPAPHLYSGYPRDYQTRLLRPAEQYSCYVPADGSELIASNYEEYVRNLTTNRVDMWEVIDAMRERGWAWTLIVDDGEPTAKVGQWIDGNYIERVSWGKGEPINELPLAASIAALRAVGHIED